MGAETVGGANRRHVAESVPGFRRVGRRVALALVISPVFLLSKSRKHFLTIGYSGEDGKQQAMVFRVDKDGIRPTLAALEARTGLKVQYQDEEARKARNQ